MSKQLLCTQMYSKEYKRTIPPWVQKLCEYTHMSTLATRILEATQEAGLTQARLAAELSIQRSTVNNWFNGRNETIGGKHLPQVCALLDVLPMWLTTGRGPKRLGEKSELYAVSPAAREAPVVRENSGEYEAQADQRLEALSPFHLALYKLCSNPNTIGKLSDIDAARFYADIKEAVNKAA
ncbi:helix-turn-helix domain-containing protein [Chitinimonas lacunae]|uniref:Multiprotein-bridging factor 1 family protein n=1 Tax=Chitinimonas lacunae TaxID=1963018 RepID=A0ABV8MJE3_9NEIS